jgi:hypothetical protein
MTDRGFPVRARDFVSSPKGIPHNQETNNLSVSSASVM